MTEPVRNREIYSGFAKGYDLVMRDVDFPGWARHILSLLRFHKINGRRLLNLACGTGTMEPVWVDAGFKVVGVDQSEEMIEEARLKNPKRTGVDFRVGDMIDVRLPEDFDVVCCLYDSVNYLTDPADVSRLFDNVAKRLAPGGAFVFDVATEANILENFTSTTYAENLPDFAYVWENEYNLGTKICRSEFAFFYRIPGSDDFRRRTETHYQRIYSTREITKKLKEAGLILLGAYDGLTRHRPTSKSDRIHFVAERPSQEG